MNSNDPYRPKELTELRKQISDKKNDTDELTFESRNGNPRAAAYKSIRDMTDDAFIAELSVRTDEDELLIELKQLEQEYIEG